MMKMQGMAMADDPEEMLKELVGSTGAWKSWSSQPLGTQKFEGNAQQVDASRWK